MGNEQSVILRSTSIVHTAGAPQAVAPAAVAAAQSHIDQDDKENQQSNEENFVRALPKKGPHVYSLLLQTSPLRDVKERRKTQVNVMTKVIDLLYHLRFSLS